ncbi:hypothetical protein [Paenibacillus illinoisensis]|uniref:hypothetical protein n=2 Tax=Paenibacillus illinoisensis TaxID=59845 RepID=UPI00301E5A84
MQRTTRSSVNQPNRTTSAPARVQSREANPQVNRIVGQVEGTGSQLNTANKVNAVACRKCKSQQVVANKRGYSFANMFKTMGWMWLLPLVLVLGFTMWAFYYNMNVQVGSGVSSTGSEALESLLTIIGVICGISIFVSLPVSILVGFVGRSEIVNGCMNCGFKWRPAKRK